jgi:hypothetical protein
MPPVPVLTAVPPPVQLNQVSTVKFGDALRPEAKPIVTYWLVPLRLRAETFGPLQTSVVQTSPSLHSALVVQLVTWTLEQFPPVQVSVVAGLPSLQFALVVQQPAVGV